MARKKVHTPRPSAAKPVKKKVRKGTSRPPRSAGGRAKSAKPLPPSSPAAVKAAAAAFFAWTHGLFDPILNSLLPPPPPHGPTFQTAPTDNHALWTLGHMAVTYSWLATLIDGKPAKLPESYNTLFGYKSVPDPDPEAYPPLDELRRRYSAAYRRFTDAIATLKPTDLHKPTVGDSHGFAHSRLDAIHKAAWHDSWHSGQLSSLRRALNLPPLM